MLEEIRKIILSGFGAVLLTREKAEEMTRKLMDEAKLSREEAQKLVDEMFETGNQQWTELEASLSRKLQKGVENLDVASRKELQDCRSRLENLEKRMEMIEDMVNTMKGG